MNINDLIRIEEAPSSGYMIAYTRREVFFEEYAAINKAKERLNDMDILELHLFDQSKEYRALLTESSRFNGSAIEYVADFPNDGQDVYVEECFIEKRFSGFENNNLSILNHINFDDNGMAVIDDYRLIMGGN